MVNKAKLLKLYMDGVHVNEIAKQCKCSVKTIYKTTAKHGLHRTERVRAPKPKAEKKPKPTPPPAPIVDEPMYREIPTHLFSKNNKSEEHKALVAELKEYRETHQKPWYLT